MPDSAVYYVDVRGIGPQPTFARVVRFADRSATPRNALEVSHGVLTEIDSHTQNSARWSRQCTLIAGRTNDEKVVIQIDASLAQHLFARPGSQFDNYQTLEELWDDRVASHLPAKK